MFAQQGLFNEKRAMRLEGFGELFGHGFVETAVEVEAGVEAQGFDGLEALDGAVEDGGGVDPVYVFGGVHFDAFEALGDACFAIFNPILVTIQSNK